MALQIKNVGGGKPEGLYAWSKSEIASELKELNKSDSTLPYSFQYGSAVVLNGEIHILGSNTNSGIRHYKWDGTTWTSVSTLPYEFMRGSAVVFNNEIHILGGYSGMKKHYKWNGSSWISVSTLPYDFYDGFAVVYNNAIHILGGSDGGTRHYKWNGSKWSSVSSIPVNFYNSCAVVFDGAIHILGDYSNKTQHYKWDGSSWTSVSTLPYSFYYGSAVVFENEIHILGSGDSSYRTNHYKWNGSTWVSVNTLPYAFYSGAAVVFDNGIHILGGTSNDTCHYLIIGYAPVYTLLDYIVSDKESAYPDKAEQDGYYYEKVGDGKQVVTGSFTVGYADTSKITITHDLGVEPYLFIAISPYVASSGQCSMLLYCADELGYGDYPIIQTYGGTMSRDVNKTFYSAGITSCVISAASGWGTKSSNTVYWIAIG